MGKIAIVTTYKAVNYGCVLQSYGLQTVLKSLGHHCENLIYLPRRPFHALLASVVKEPSRILKRVRRSWPTRRGNLFKRFVEQHIHENDHLYQSMDDLRSTNAVYDVFICGSDQIWAPNQFQEWYYLNFVDERHRKIAYAPSIGLPSIPDRLKPRMRALIEGIKYLSIREKQGADIVYELTGIRVPVVLDPSMLLDRDAWLRVATEPAIEEPYVLCHLLGANPRHRDLIREYSRRMGCRIVVLPFVPADHTFGDIQLEEVDPFDYVGLVARARSVFTDSFHGVAFAINLNRPLYVFFRFTADHVLCQNSRIVNILDTFGLSRRLIEDDCPRIETEDDIDYGAVNEILANKREYSFGYLTASLRESMR